MATGGLRKTEDGITASLMAIIRRGRSASSYLDRVVWPKYQQAQIERFQSLNATQGSPWPALNPDYVKRKRRRFADYPGGGNAMMVATSRLSQGAMGNNPSYFNRLVDDSSIQVAINISALPYAAYPGLTRPFMSFNAETVRQWTDGLAAYIMTGVE